MFGKKFFRDFKFFTLLFVVFVGSSTMLLDLYTKYLCGALVEDIVEIEVLPFLNLVDVRNTGMSFGLLKGFQFSNVFFICLNVPLVVFILLFSCCKCGVSLEGFALGLVLGGALGNVVDRVAFGAVRDFIDLHVLGWHWPAFNLADVAIFLGVMCLLYRAWKNEQNAD
ncbi:signal peptidase II [Neorickettsia helminthoeca str. Oregon]|uniref:Lipoprotein signal peptidase n=1 Tax=Neorickettsia helminthoeca str. Oregon TaxID=1286528 RepID=X5HL09_9RICK|nr:signal peptidase II [Neorickettsia helminthoeca]AHX11789.1 signal peptidase II [Neorickettsia helminthoeca str. Oregon]